MAVYPNKYNKKTNWREGDYVTAADMNKIEQGIYDSEVYTDEAIAALAVAKTGTSDPTTSTSGTLGQHYVNTSTRDVFICTYITGNAYTWKKQYKWNPTEEKYYLVDGDGEPIDLTVVDENFAPSYDSTATYAVGDLVTYEGRLYYCIKATTAGTLPTNTTYFEEKSVADIIEMIKAGTIVVGHSQVADNLTPYSEDSGAIQDTPFISQETGTANNTVIVTTGDKAKQLEKIGTGVVVNQLIPDANKSKSFVTTNVNAKVLASGIQGNSGEKWLFMWNQSKTLTSVTRNTPFYVMEGSSPVYQNTNDNVNLSAGMKYWLTTLTATGRMEIRYWCNTPNVDVDENDMSFVNLTQWFNGNENIPADLLANPSHFSWYYNGELTFNAGEIKHGEGVKLVCTRGRNLFNGNVSGTRRYLDEDGTIVQTAGWYITDYILVVPNAPLYFYNASGSMPSLCFYDKDKNYISGITNYNIRTSGKVATPPANCVYIRHSFQTDECITPYYTPAQGGEGYDQYYPYEEPDIIDTGSEQLGAFDKKTPDGVIERNGDKYTFTGSEVWSQVGSAYVSNIADIKNKIKLPSSNGGIITWQVNDANLQKTSANRLYLGTETSGFGLDTSGTLFIGSDDYAHISSLTGKTIEFELRDSEKTTEQGTSFRQYAGINDYGIMYWLGANDELVSIPQGLKIQYPVNYKGFIDDLYMYTDGDATNLLLKTDIMTTAEYDQVLAALQADL